MTFMTLPICHYQIVTFVSLPNCDYQIDITKNPPIDIMFFEITILIHNKDDIEFVTKFPCFLEHPVN